jgi:hypothetical protein
MRDTTCRIYRTIVKEETRERLRIGDSQSHRKALNDIACFDSCIAVLRYSDPEKLSSWKRVVVLEVVHVIVCHRRRVLRAIYVDGPGGSSDVYLKLGNVDMCIATLRVVFDDGWSHVGVKEPCDEILLLASSGASRRDIALINIARLQGVAVPSCFLRRIPLWLSAWSTDIDGINLRFARSGNALWWRGEFPLLLCNATQ